MKRVLSFVTTLGLLAGAFVPLAARAEKGGRDGKPGLSEEQKDKLKAAKRAHREAAAELRARLGKSMRRLGDQVQDGAKDEAIAATLDELAKTRKAMLAEREKFEAEAAKILTPTQRARKLLAMKRGGGKRGFFQRRGMGRGHGGGWD